MVKGRVPHYELIVTINAIVSKYCSIGVALSSVSEVVKEMSDIILDRCYKHRGGEPDRDYMCLYIVCNQCVL